MQGALELIDTLAHWLKTLTGMPAVALSPAAGRAWRAVRHHGDPRRARSARRQAQPHPGAGIGAWHEPGDGGGLRLCGRADPGRQQAAGSISPRSKAKLGPDVAALMLTNPNTCGLFENEILEIAAAVHAAGAFFYCDGANFNAIVGRVRPADLGIDALHINLHKTFSTPHGGGGPGSGPVVLAAEPGALRAVAVDRARAGRVRADRASRAARRRQTIGRLKGFHGQMGMFVRALAYMMSHGADGLRQVAEDAVLNANYLRVKLQDVLSVSFPGICMHEVLFDDRFLKDTGVTTLDFAKALIDEGYHPMTMYFPLVVHGAMLIEPTETESKASLDQFVDGAARRSPSAARGGRRGAFPRRAAS